MNSKQVAKMTRESIERDKKAAHEREARRRLELAKELHDAIERAAAKGNWGCVVEVLGYQDDVNYVVRSLQSRGFHVSVRLLPDSDVTDVVWDVFGVKELLDTCPPKRCFVAITWTEEGDKRDHD